jgi:hypothetical protein
MTSRPRLTSSLRTAVAAAVLASLLGAAAACAEPRSPSGGADDADAGELSCAERQQARAICIGAMRDRCRGQQNDCEVSCDARVLPANTMKHPSGQDDLDAPRCREACRTNGEACLRSTEPRCPGPCE